MTLEVIAAQFSVCKVESLASVDLSRPFTFTAVTDSETSIVSPTEYAPHDAVAREDGWRAIRVKGQLDFSLIGIIAEISAKLAANGIAVFVISTYDTDYVLVKEENLQKAKTVLKI